MMQHRAYSLGALAAVAVLAACGGGGSGSALPSHITAPMSGSLTYTLKVPTVAKQLRPHVPNALRPLDQSPATLGLSVSIALAPAAPQPVTSPNAAFNLDPAACATPSCTTNADGSRTYTLTTATVPVGTYNVLIATWDATPAPVGTPFTSTPVAKVPMCACPPVPQELSDAATVVNVTGPNTNINVTLNGVPASVVAVPLEGQSHVVPDGTGTYDIIGNVATQWSVAALDVDGYIIAGDGAPLITFNDATNSFVATNEFAPSNLYAISAVAAQPSPVPITFNATGLGPSNVTVSSAGSVSVLPMQELWTTAAGMGLNGYRLTPPGYTPPVGPYGCCSGYTPTDQYASLDMYESVAQDSSGALWVYDASTNAILQFTQSFGATLAPTGTKISTTGLIISSLAGDANGFLYGIDSLSNDLVVWKVVGAAPSLQHTVPISNTLAAGVSVAPTLAKLPAGIPGSVLVSDSAGVDFYTNASAGAPTYIAPTVPDPVPASGPPLGLVAAAISPDSSTLWTSDTNYTTAYSGFKSLTDVTLLAQGDPDDDQGNIAAGIGGYVFEAQGADSSDTIDSGYASGTSVYLSLEMFLGGITYGVCISP